MDVVLWVLLWSQIWLHSSYWSNDRAASFCHHHLEMAGRHGLCLQGEHMRVCPATKNWLPRRLPLPKRCGLLPSKRTCLSRAGVPRALSPQFPWEFRGGCRGISHGSCRTSFRKACGLLPSTRTCLPSAGRPRVVRGRFEDGPRTSRDALRTVCGPSADGLRRLRGQYGST